MPRGIWGLDISRTSIKAARLERKKDSIVLTRVDVLPYVGGTDAAPDEEGLRAALKEIKKRCGIGGERVACTLPSHSTFNRLIRLPPVPEEQVKEIVSYEAGSQIPFPLDEVYWDYQLVEREYQPGEEREVILFAVKREIVESFLRSIEAVGLNIEIVQFAPVGLYNFLTYDQNPEPGTIVLDVGAENTDLVLLDGARFWVRNIPINGNQFTKAIKGAMKVKGAEAEKLKRNAQTQKLAKVYAALQPVYQELTSEIHRSLGWYKSISRGTRFVHLLLLGNGSKAPNFQRFLSQSLSMQANRINRLAQIEMGSRVDQGALASNLATLGTAIGLGLQGYGVTRNKVNLLPPAYRRARLIKAKEPMAIATAAVMLVAAIVAMLMTDRRARSLEMLQMSLETANQTYQQRLGLLHQARTNLAPVRDALETFDGLHARRDVDLRLMNMLAGNIPDNATAPEGQKIWVVEVTGEQMDAAPPVDTTRGSPQTPERFVPSHRRLHYTIEVALPLTQPPRAETVIRELLFNQLLNWNAPTNEQRDPARASLRTLIMDDTGTVTGQIVLASAAPVGDRARLVGSSYTFDPAGGRPADPKYTIWQITVDVDPTPPPEPAPTPEAH